MGLNCLNNNFDVPNNLLRIKQVFWAGSYTNKGRGNNWSISIENGKASTVFHKRF